MPRICTICSHAERQAIDEALVSGAAIRKTAALYRVSEDSLQRHKREHLPDKLVKAQQAREIFGADRLLNEMTQLRDKLWTGLAEAERAGSGAGVVAFAREYRNTLESYFNIADRIAQRQGDGNEPALTVRIERVGLSETCPHCGNAIEAATG